MPAGNVRPRASQVEPLDRLAVEAWINAGWTLSDHGRLTLGMVVGPCARCTVPTVRYGRHGQPLCPTCRQPAGDTP